MCLWFEFTSVGRMGRAQVAQVGATYLQQEGKNRRRKSEEMKVGTDLKVWSMTRIQSTFCQNQLIAPLVVRSVCARSKTLLCLNTVLAL